MILASWLASTNQDNKNARVLFLQNISLSHCKKQLPHRYANLKGTLNRYEHLIQVHLHCSVFNLTHSDSSEKVTLERLINLAPPSSKLY